VLQFDTVELHDVVPGKGKDGGYEGRDRSIESRASSLRAQLAAKKGGQRDDLCHLKLSCINAIPKQRAVK